MKTVKVLVLLPPADPFSPESCVYSPFILDDGVKVSDTTFYLDVILTPNEICNSVAIAFPDPNALTNVKFVG